ncbi:polysaccharide pyruvyl transferase family protein [Leptospira andrefontaineae]|uniref:Polysaccharide pyruvyl transferase family protein n=1 Tax=Leptospira andrefontaineae TaxID=2484976 RepID=A0A4R9HCU6_9LEPT|nr:polysaccharide pyruvyl transferase family protein [Leptospira andrefontaineae]TGK44560.1 polysaccharide pyruvyl transferase family protein [Leptospira andrefontaineae]
MRIGIMTFWESKHNYGQLLQAYAMQKVLKKLGHTPFIIRFKRISPLGARKLGALIHIIIRALKHPLQGYRRFIEESFDPRRFNEFRSKYLNFSEGVYNSIEALNEAPPNADAYIVGSDQVWSPIFSVSFIPYLLGFAPKGTKRIAYAASFGTSKLDIETSNVFKRYIPEFNAIGVREKSGMDIGISLGRNDFSVVPDPTILLSPDEWRSFYREEKENSSDNFSVFLYTLSDSLLLDRKKIFKFVKSIGRYRHVSANGDYSSPHFLTIPQWLSSIDRSDCVITNSFHCTVFSLLLNKEFFVIPNAGKLEGMNDRLYSLLEKVQLQDRFLFEFDTAKINQLRQTKIEWDKVNNILKSWREEGTDFLLKHLGKS